VVEERSDDTTGTVAKKNAPTLKASQIDLRTRWVHPFKLRNSEPGMSLRSSPG
jgi:hypothetical protein